MLDRAALIRREKDRLLKRFPRENDERFFGLLAELLGDARALEIATAVTFPVSEIVAEWHRLVLALRVLLVLKSTYLRGSRMQRLLCPSC